MTLDLKIEILGADEIADLSEGLTIAARMLDEPPPLSIGQVQLLYDQLREAPHISFEQQVALGLAFGEAFVEYTDYEWVKASDDYGVEMALSPVGFHVACYPISMIQQRLADGDQVDLAQLRSKIVGAISDKVAAGDVAPR